MWISQIDRDQAKPWDKPDRLPGGPVNQQNLVETSERHESEMYVDGVR
ncbi:hypothetical protein [Rhodococcus jostii]|uniref:Uncharacterized protein n=1 Tax=Rhodococcus jostii TaxID=132919 RepID=A0ABU4CT61_RHOJO|nr:hypothetical protein [Rhodococcus jostii]MDV6286472.1 hypothetical protein [Rhodococcus jostii]